MTQTLSTEKRTRPIEKTYRVIQWGMGNVGTLALRHFAHNPVYRSRWGAVQSTGEGQARTPASSSA